MNHYYSNTHKSWYPDEDAQLIRAHKHKTYTIFQLSHIHKRTPGNIIRRLKKLRLINNLNEVNGYQMYRNSDLFYVLNPQKSEPKPKEPEKTPTINPWTQTEDAKLFLLKNQSLSVIASTLNRNPGAVAHRMKELKIVKALNKIDGYDAYKNSPQFKVFRKKAEKPKDPAEALRGEVNSLREELAAMHLSFNNLSAFIRSVFVKPSHIVNSALKKVYEIGLGNNLRNR